MHINCMRVRTHTQDVHIIECPQTLVLQGVEDSLINHFTPGSIHE